MHLYLQRKFHPGRLIEVQANCCRGTQKHRVKIFNINSGQAVGRPYVRSESGVYHELILWALRGTSKDRCLVNIFAGVLVHVGAHCKCLVCCVG